MHISRVYITFVKCSLHACALYTLSNLYAFTSLMPGQQKGKEKKRKEERKKEKKEEECITFK